MDGLLPKCVARRVSIVVGGPFNSGILAGRDTWNYDRPRRRSPRGAKTIGAVCERHEVPLPAAALQFPVAHPAVAAVIPGPRGVVELADNLKLLQHLIPPALWADLRAEKLLHPDAPTRGDNSPSVPLLRELIPLFGQKIPLLHRSLSIQITYPS